MATITGMIEPSMTILTLKRTTVIAVMLSAVLSTNMQLTLIIVTIVTGTLAERHARYPGCRLACVCGAPTDPSEAAMTRRGAACDDPHRR